MSTQNVPSTTNLLPNVNEFQMFQTIAKNAQASGLYKGVGEESKIFMILLAARELGVSPMLALNGGIWNIQGKIEISARLMNSLIRRAGHSLEIKECNNKVCTLKGKRADNGDTAEASFTIEEAQVAGLSNRDVWKKYAQDMLYARAMSRLARRLFSDVIGTAYVEGEIRDSVEKPQDLPQAEFEDITPKQDGLSQEQWKELNDLINQCTPRAKEAVWSQIHAMEILGDDDYNKMPLEEFLKLRNACLGNIAKQKAEKEKAKKDVEACNSLVSNKEVVNG